MTDWKLALLGLLEITFTVIAAKAAVRGTISIKVFLGLTLGTCATFVVIANVPWGAIRAGLRELTAGVRTSRGLCPQCGYNLTGNTSGTCPECGVPTPQRPR